MLGVSGVDRLKACLLRLCYQGDEVFRHHMYLYKTLSILMRLKGADYHCEQHHEITIII